MFRLKYWIAIFASLILFNSASLAQTPAQQGNQGDTCKHTITGDVEISDFSSKIFNNTRKVRVFLPPGYNDPANQNRKYAVLYMFDGQNLFDACTAYDHVHEWQVDETITTLVKEGRMEPVIVVGIDNAGEKRADEYLPWKDDVQNPFMAEPHGKLLPEFMLNELMPAMQKKYRIDTDRPQAIGGSSYGGVAALYVSLMAPTVFKLVLAESPIVWVGNGELIRQTRPLPMGPERLFMAFGGKEFNMENNPNVLRSVRDLLSQLQKNYEGALAQPTDVLNLFDPDAKHHESAWAKRFPGAMQFLFPPRPAAAEKK